MSDEEFYKKYPRDKFDIKFISYKETGFKGEVEKNTYEIRNKETGELIGTATRTEQTKYGDYAEAVTWCI